MQSYYDKTCLAVDLVSRILVSFLNRRREKSEATGRCAIEYLFSFKLCEISKYASSSNCCTVCRKSIFFPFVSRALFQREMPGACMFVQPRCTLLLGTTARAPRVPQGPRRDLAAVSPIVHPPFRPPSHRSPSSLLHFVRKRSSREEKNERDKFGRGSLGSQQILYLQILIQILPRFNLLQAMATIIRKRVFGSGEFANFWPMRLKKEREKERIEKEQKVRLIQRSIKEEIRKFKHVQILVKRAKNFLKLFQFFVSCMT